jgi:hypothetical protein
MDLTTKQTKQWFRAMQGEAVTVSPVCMSNHSWRFTMMLMMMVVVVQRGSHHVS